MVSKELVIGITVVLAAFAIMSVKIEGFRSKSGLGPSYQVREGWRPFAWYGYPGTKKGSLGYQARGDWCGVDKATRTVGKPLPLIAPSGCGRTR
jgi:hypothetical protein